MLAKCENEKKHCFLKSYGFHSLQGVINALKTYVAALGYLFYKNFLSNKKN